VNTFDLITDACEEARSEGVVLVRGAFYDWTSPVREDGLPKSCNALGAVLLVRGFAKTEHAWPKLCEILDVGEFWLYRFCIGWDNMHQLVYYTEEKGGKLVAHLDDVSGTARSLSKKYMKARSR